MTRVAIFPSLIAPVSDGRCFGGAEIAALALAEALAARGHEVTLVGVAGSGGRGLAHLEAPATPPFVPGEEVGEDRGHFPEILAALAGRVDVVHAHFNDPGGLLALDDAAKRGLRAVSTLHLSAVFPATTRVVRATLAAGTPVRYVAPSAFAAASYGAGVAVIPNGVDPKTVAFQPVPGLPARLAWAGRRVPEKGLEAAIEIARRAGLPLEIAGPGPRIEAPGVVDRGLLSRGEVGALLGGAVATLITSSIAEAHPLVAIESLLAGTPVVGFAVGGLPEIVRGPAGILVPPGDREAAVAAIAKARGLSRLACRAHAEAEFAHAAMVEAYERLYRRGS